MSTPGNLPVAVIGGGPIGLAAAAHLVTRGVPVKLYEAGETVAAHVRSWGHVRLFSPWRHNTDTAARAILRDRGWQEPPAGALPTGGDLYAAYLQPLAQTPATEARERISGPPALHKTWCTTAARNLSRENRT